MTHDAFAGFALHPSLNSAGIGVLGLLLFYVILQIRRLTFAVTSIPGLTDAQRLEERMGEVELKAELGRHDLSRRFDEMRQLMISREAENEKYRRASLEVSGEQLKEFRKLRVSQEREQREVNWIKRVLQERPCTMEGCSIEPPPEDSIPEEPSEQSDEEPWLRDREDEGER